jgi:thiaminase
MQGTRPLSTQGTQMDARELLRQIGDDLMPVHERIVAHRFLDALERREVSRDALRVLATQQYLIVSNGIRNIALLLSRYGDAPSRPVLNGFLQAEFAVHEAVGTFARAVSLTKRELDEASAIVRALVFSYYESYLCAYGSDADLITAFYFDAQVWIRNARRVSEALQRNYGMSADEVTFFEMYANYQPAEEDVVPYLQAALDRGETPRQVEEATRLLLEGELMFWEAIAQEAGV